MRCHLGSAVSTLGGSIFGIASQGSPQGKCIIGGGVTLTHRKEWEGRGEAATLNVTMAQLFSACVGLNIGQSKRTSHASCATAGGGEGVCPAQIPCVPPYCGWG